MSLAQVGLGLLGAGLLAAGWTYVGYPLWLAAARRRPVRAPAAGALPRVRILVPAHDEADLIAGKLENLLRASDGLDAEIVVIDDGSRDGTAAIVERFAGRGVRLLRLARCVGKNGAIDEAMRRLAPHPPLVATTDVDARIDRAGLRRLLAAAADPSVGVAAARVVYASGGGASREQGYFAYENLVRRLESRSGACVSIGGQFEVHRASIWRPLPGDAATDMATALLARAAGLAAIQVDEAVVTTVAGGALSREIGRKRRTIRRALGAVRWLWGALGWNDRVRIVSHKFARYLLPVYQAMIALGAALVAAPWPVGVGLVVGGAGAFALAVAWGVLGRSCPALIRAVAYYEMVHVIGLVEVLRSWAGLRSQVAWSRAR